MFEKTPEGAMVKARPVAGHWSRVAFASGSATSFAIASTSKWQTGWWYTYPSEKYESIGMIILNIWETMIMNGNGK